ncbi:hypothetical protein [Nocardia rhizosphaerihabitans]|uniref:Uncharacterized protein n=1 Tax=Nocardia rhizosphaerihabitans TaxID=1691570 RepID=A0ABQ2K595_9NOCA|nr:hypothetical protein [Nocardia rhizosphaerihabitans]GGN66147.1 hypothetical protein GCM10011610_00800 [Nocardia rhizosphaerihabitans]
MVALTSRDHRLHAVGRRLDPATVQPPSTRAGHRTEPLPITGAHPPLVAIVGAHGGAATSTLARWWAPAADCGQLWPASPETTQRVVIAARLCLPGLTACADRLREWQVGAAPDGVEVIGVVLTAAHSGRVPAAVRRYRATVADLTEVVWEIGWHDELLERELSELAQFTPFTPAPPRRSGLTETVPADVHRIGGELIAALATSLKTATEEQDSER